MENLQIQKEETENEIKQLHNIASEIEILKDKTIGLGNHKLDVFIQEISKEIEWSEVVLQEIESSIEFNENGIL